MNNKTLLYAAGLGGLLAAIGSSIPIVSFLNCLFCAWLWIGGGLAVRLYNSRESTSVEAGQGALIGAAAGLVAAVITVALSLVFNMLGFTAQAAIDPQLAEDYLGGLAITGLITALGFVFYLIIFPIFGALGGVIGASIFKKK